MSGGVRLCARVYGVLFESEGGVECVRVVCEVV